MSVAFKLIGFGLRQVLAETGNAAADAVEKVVEHLWTDHSQTLPMALARANDRSWQALTIALAGDGFLEQVRVFFASADDKGIRRQVQQFLAAQGDAFPGASQEFRQTCLAELKQARQAGHLTVGQMSARDVGRQVAAWPRYANPGALIAGAHEAVARLADDLAGPLPNLARLLRLGAPGEPPLLASAFGFFFRREVETDPELARGLLLDGVQRLYAAQESAFAQVGAALQGLGDNFDRMMGQLDRIESGVLDLRVELERFSRVQTGHAGELRLLLQEVLDQLDRVGMRRGEVKAVHSFSIRSADERQAVKQLLDRFRRLSPQEQQQVPALLNGLGKLQIGAGDFAGAEQTFTQVTRVVADPGSQAEAHYNAYRAALEQKHWDAALKEIVKAAELDAARFAPFPLERYTPRKILGAGGFGTAFFCRDEFLNVDVVVKTLHAADLQRNLGDVFQEAQLLKQLRHPAIIAVQDCSYVDLKTKSRPYIVMEYFPGVTLESFVQERGVLNTDQLLQVARQVAVGVEAAHQQNILHRDLKPANVLVHQQGDQWQVKIIDFGLALRQASPDTGLPTPSGDTRLGESLTGSLKYAPPEQMGQLPGVAPGPYSDVYSFGKLCCFALFQTTDVKPRHWASIPSPLAALVARCTEEQVAKSGDDQPHERPGSFGPVLQALANLTAPPQPKPTPVPPAPQKSVATAKPVTPPPLPRAVPVKVPKESREERVARQLREAEQAKQRARQWEQQHNYAAAVEELEKNVPEDLLDAAWYQSLVQRKNRVVQLEGEIDEDEGKQRFKGLQAKIRELIGLQPHRAADFQGLLALLPKEAPVLRRAPFATDKAKEYQRLWADYHGLPTHKTVSLGQIKSGGFLGLGAREFDVEMKFVLIPPGEFLMGSPEGEEGRYDNETQHKVKITQGYWMGVHPVTQGQWQVVMGNNPSNFKGDNLPVENVSWEDCQKFCAKLGKVYRLPTEAEWEYACRAGTDTAFHSGNGEQALRSAGWYNGNSGSQTHPVGQLQANAWGLQDMHGNVWEWCADWFGDYPKGNIEDPKGSNSGTGRVLRGGSWGVDPWGCRAAYRRRYVPVGRNGNCLGLRVCFRLD